ncbi:MAG: hypothetical protein IPH03_09115 [Tetrasphaera sp.]|nr:hypothetical protein [Tetrasphaera sp.]
MPRTAVVARFSRASVSSGQSSGSWLAIGSMRIETAVSGGCALLMAARTDGTSNPSVAKAAMMSTPSSNDTELWRAGAGDQGCSDMTAGQSSRIDRDPRTDRAPLTAGHRTGRQPSAAQARPPRHTP